MECRNFVRAGVGSIVAVGVASAAFAMRHNRRAEWGTAMSRYLHERARINAISGDAVVNDFIDAETAIMGTRTPDLKALRWKVERFHEMADHTVIEAKDFEHLLSDISHLLGGS